MTRWSTFFTDIPQPPGHSVQAERTRLISPLGGIGIQGQFWLQMEISSVTFQGKGDSAVPAAPPRMNAKKLLRSTFI
jgi:hypothetical protein